MREFLMPWYSRVLCRLIVRAQMADLLVSIRSFAGRLVAESAPALGLHGTLAVA